MLYSSALAAVNTAHAQPERDTDALKRPERKQTLTRLTVVLGVIFPLHNLESDSH